MADDSHVSKTLEDMRRQLMAKLDEARNGLVGINAIETSFGLPLTTLADLLSGMTVGSGSAGSATLPGNGAAARRTGPVRADDFLGMEPMEAAKRYMQRAGHAVEFDEIADAVQKGGAVVGGAGWRERLETSLMRSSKGVIKIGEKTYALEEFYSEEQIKRIRDSRRASRSRPDKKKRRKPRPVAPSERPAKAVKQLAAPKGDADGTKASDGG